MLSYNGVVGPGSVYARPAKCDGIKHSESELVVSISTGWFSSGSLCGKKILIKSFSGMSVVAKVVSECNSQGGCRPYFQPPCGNNMIEATKAVFGALRLRPTGYVQVKWAFTT
ncbi:putative ripening-related protein 1 [Acorus calamus]|uniref:Ripening-related protein 1 n=1 Tax=Acorus calamus TaxID=4465 RepID=A0AAV9CLH6_ACOCL|nr:putative ripening-related protein 1 [Acorus calamus]